MQPKELSIIIPCYNCTSTLEEAVNSIFEQNLQIPFEVIMVDDGSTDGTYALMEKISKQHQEIRIFFHEKNLGGGATRNTAVKNTVSDIIFCLDSDDILPKEILPKMLSFMKEKKCDGVLFEETRFFYDRDISKTENIKNSVLDRSVEICDFFKENIGFLVKVNFLYTKKSFDLCGGYPTDHGFDTQDFGLRFLASGSVAYVCPNTFYFHRRSRTGHSYFMREFSEGKVSFNTYLMYEDIMHLLSDDVITEIYTHDVMGDSILIGKTLGKKILDLFNLNKDGSFFVYDYKDYILKANTHGIEHAEVSFLHRSNFSKKILKAVSDYKEGNYKNAILLYLELIKDNPNIKMLYVGLMRSILCESNQTRKESNENTFNAFYTKQPLSKLVLLVNKFERRLNSWLMK